MGLDCDMSDSCKKRITSLYLDIFTTSLHLLICMLSGRCLCPSKSYILCSRKFWNWVKAFPYRCFGRDFVVLSQRMETRIRPAGRVCPVLRNCGGPWFKPWPQNWNISLDFSLSIAIYAYIVAWSRIVIETLTVPHLVWKLPVFYGIRTFISVATKARYFYL